MALTDPNLGLTYGWTLGESGWHTNGRQFETARRGGRSRRQDRDLVTLPAGSGRWRPLHHSGRCVTGCVGWQDQPDRRACGQCLESATAEGPAGFATSMTRPCSRPTKDTGWSAGIAI